MLQKHSFLPTNNKLKRISFDLQNAICTNAAFSQQMDTSQPSHIHKQRKKKKNLYREQHQENDTDPKSFLLFIKDERKKFTFLDIKKISSS